MTSRSYVGPGIIILVGLACGYGVAMLADSPYNDPCQGSPAMAAFGAFMFGTVVALVVVTVASILSIIVDAILGGRSSKTAAGCAGVEALGIAAAVIGFLVFQVIPIHWVPPC